MPATIESQFLETNLSYRQGRADTFRTLYAGFPDAFLQFQQTDFQWIDSIFWRFWGLVVGGEVELQIRPQMNQQWNWDYTDLHGFFLEQSQFLSM